MALLIQQPYPGQKLPAQHDTPDAQRRAARLLLCQHNKPVLRVWGVDVNCIYYQDDTKQPKTAYVGLNDLDVPVIVRVVDGWPVG